MSGSGSPLFIDEAPEAFGHHQCGCAKLDDLDITAGNQQLERTAADPRVAAGIVLIEEISFDREYGHATIHHKVQMAATGRAHILVESGELLAGTLSHTHCFDPATDRIMLCRNMCMIRGFSAYFDAVEFHEGVNAKSGRYVIERAFGG